MKRWIAWIGSLSLVACGTRVSPDASDSATSDVTVVEVFAPDADVIEDVWTTLDIRDADAADAADVAEVVDVVDVVRDATPCDPPSEPRPARTLNSCSGPNGAPAEHCREVWVCPTTPTRLGSTQAWVRGREFAPRRQAPACDMVEVRVHPAYIDAYEVSVARFRAWVLAGRPQPPPAAQLWMMPTAFARWRTVERWEDPTYSCEEDGRCTRPDPARCTYRATPGENDNLPINCVDGADELAFCWWDGKHRVTEALWEHVARNGGRTALPFSDRVASWPPSNPCDYGDIAGCPRTMGLPHAIDAHPLGQSVSPAGVFGLWGGVAEVAWSTSRELRLACHSVFGLPPPELGTYFAEISVRGRDFTDTTEWAARYDHAATWSMVVRAQRHAGDGIRCARWVPEPFAPEM